MRIGYRIVAAAGATVALLAAGAGIAAAEEATPPKDPLVGFIESWPPAPAGCDRIWDPIEDAVEDSVPAYAQPAFDAFDDWCEGDAD
ncbi:hypothetical protein [Nocardia sp. NPDC051833]|uniref:hypothetical protein n=1 Tax=Nocardia sp. NPDC051833 TaxID=3155674 RepID=UPI00341C41C3